MPLSVLVDANVINMSAGRSRSPLRMNSTRMVKSARMGADKNAEVEATQVVITNGLCIGTEKAVESGIFFSGLSDDIQIYNRTVHP